MTVLQLSGSYRVHCSLFNPGNKYRFCWSLVHKNRPFSSCLVPLFQNESWCTTFHIETSLICKIMNEQVKLISITRPNNGCAPGLVLKQRQKATLKWPLAWARKILLICQLFTFVNLFTVVLFTFSSLFPFVNLFTFVYYFTFVYLLDLFTFAYLFACFYVYLFTWLVYLFTSCKWLVEGWGPWTRQASESAHWRCDRLNSGHCWRATGMYAPGRGG